MPHGRDQRPMQLPGVTKLVLGLAESFCMQNEAFVQHFTYVVFRRKMAYAMQLSKNDMPSAERFTVIFCIRFLRSLHRTYVEKVPASSVRNQSVRFEVGMQDWAVQATLNVPQLGLIRLCGLRCRIKISSIR